MTSGFEGDGSLESNSENSYEQYGSGKRAAIPDFLADRKCQKMGSDSLLQELNTCLKTDYSHTHDGIETLLAELMSRDFDFGTAYAYVRGIWKNRGNDENIWDRFARMEEQGNLKVCRRQERISKGIIHHPFDVYPRRIWDIYANRVVPYHFAVASDDGSDPWSRMHWAVSHSWTSDMIKLDTPINGYEWPVPFPAGITTEAVRKELLCLISDEYVWLDVLCLRQQSSKSDEEAVRAEEWAIDVPTIGAAYKCHNNGAVGVIRYFNGLGRAFKWEEWGGKYHWTSRVWTLQENHGLLLDGGLPEGTKDIFEIKSIEEEKKASAKRYLDALPKSRSWMFSDPLDTDGFMNIVDEVRRRNATNPVDKITVVASLLELEISRYPRYQADISPEMAWLLYIEHMASSVLTMLLFGFPIPGDQGHMWRPSWGQLMCTEKPLPIMPSFEADRVAERVIIDKNGHLHFNGLAFTAQLTLYEELEKASSTHSMSRQVHAVFEQDSSRTLPSSSSSKQDIELRACILAERNGSQHQFELYVKRHSTPPDGSYTFVGILRGHETRWIIATRDSNGGFRKVSIGRMEKESNEELRKGDICIRRECVFV